MNTYNIDTEDSERPDHGGTQLTLTRQMRQRKQARDYQSKKGSNTQHWDQEETDMET